MNYRHAFHAGNFADLVKHAGLLCLLSELQAAPAPLAVIDTHAGRGMYDLASAEAKASGEAKAGVVRLMTAADAPAQFEGLKAAVAALNPQGVVRRYPGSPWLVAEALRPGDSDLACELRADDHAALAQLLKGRAAVRTACADGFTAAARETPTKGPALVLIDPPFERADDYARTVQTASAVRRRNAQAVVLAWLPLKDLETFDAFLRLLEEAEAGPLTVGEARMRPLIDPMKMNGCALVALGAPTGFAAALAPICDWTAGALGEGGKGRTYTL